MTWVRIQFPGAAEKNGQEILYMGNYGRRISSFEFGVCFKLQERQPEAQPEEDEFLRLELER